VKAFWNALAIVLLINALAMLAAAAYLRADGRLSTQRLRDATAIFALSIEQQEQREQAAAQQAALEAEQALRQHHLQRVAEGPVSTRDQIERDLQAEEIALLQVQRMREEIRALQRQLEIARQAVARQKDEHDAQRAAWEQSIAEELQRREDEDFQTAVALYQRLKPAHAKDMFLQLIAAGRSDQVVQYLAAMQQRKAAAILREFKGLDEIPVATELLEQLRRRGTSLVLDVPADRMTPGAG
jgi:delta 1-pyrroline-5-carboxylate dehydrogenase